MSITFLRGPKAVITGGVQDQTNPLILLYITKSAFPGQIDFPGPSGFWNRFFMISFFLCVCVNTFIEYIANTLGVKNRPYLQYNAGGVLPLRPRYTIDINRHTTQYVGLCMSSTRGRVLHICHVHHTRTLDTRPLNIMT